MINVKFNVVSTIFVFISIVIIFLLLIQQYIKTKVKILRILLLFLSLLFVLKVEYKTAKQSNKLNVILLIDTSYSMKFNHRTNKIKQLLDVYFPELVKKYNIELYRFDEKLYKIETSTDIAWTQKGTEIHTALDKVLSLVKNPSLVLLISDGINTNKMLPSVKNDKVYVIPVTFEEPNFRDISIVDVKYSRIGFTDVEHELKIKVVSYGYNNVECKLKLINISSGEIIKENVYKIKDNENEFKISFIPKTVGKQRLKVEIQRFDNEVSYENNDVYIDIDVKKNKIRILYICGQPSPEYFNLRNLLKNDPSIDLVSFVILRNPEDVVIVPDEDLALIPFPVYDIFVKELFNYDLVIFENFSYTKFGITMGHLENLRQFVLSGGGFIMIGGENSFYLGGYKYTPIEELLPVVLSENEEMIYTEYRPEVVNYTEPLVKIFDDDKENRYTWNNIPFLGNYQKVNGVKENSIVLLKYHEMPIACYTMRGKGRIFAMMTNTTWRWTLGNIINENYDFKKLYTRFWKNVIYFISGAEEIKNVYIICGDMYNIGETVDINIVSNVEFQPSQLQVYITLPDKTKKYLSVRKMSGNKKYQTVFNPTTEGKYIINAVVNKTNVTFRDEKEINVGTSSYNEVCILKPDIEYMRKLAELYSSKLEYIDSIDIIDIANIVSSVEKKLSSEFKSSISIYNNPILGIIFITIFLLEIYFARYKR